MSNTEKKLIEHLDKLSLKIEEKLKTFDLDKAIQKQIEWQNMTPKQRIEQFSKEWEEHMKQYR